jgi:hypothetical protein
MKMGTNVFGVVGREEVGEPFHAPFELGNERYVLKGREVDIVLGNVNNGKSGVFVDVDMVKSILGKSKKEIIDLVRNGNGFLWIDGGVPKVPMKIIENSYVSDLGKEKGGVKRIVVKRHGSPRIVLSNIPYVGGKQFLKPEDVAVMLGMSREEALNAYNVLRRKFRDIPVVVCDGEVRIPLDIVNVISLSSRIMDVGVRPTL